MDESIKQLPPNPVKITVDDSNNFWNKMAEKVSSSPSTRHIGTYKAATSNKTNALIQAKMTSIQYETGFPLSRTTNCVNVSLLKKGKGITPSDLRTIWLMEADLNAGAKVHFVKRMMNTTAINNNLIPESQYAKKGCKAIEAALVKILFFDFLRQTRKPGVIFASDLMQCFDLMAHPVCSLVSQRLGVDISVIQFMLLAVQQMMHRTRTGYGDSDCSYGNDTRNPLQWGGQGNGASLPLWLAISCILLAVLESTVTGVQIHSSISLELLTFIAIMHVDNTDILLTDTTGQDTLEIVFKRAQRAARIWQQAINDSGGAMRPEKCYWSVVNFRFVAGRWKYMKFDEFEGTIAVKDTNNVSQVVERFDIDKAKEGLGIFVTPNGKMITQLEKIVDKVNKWSNRLKISHLNSKEAYIGANTTIFKTIEYVLPATSFNERQCCQIERALYNHLLGKLKVSSKFPLEYRFGPHKLQGAALMEVFVSQLIGNLSLFLHHANIKSQLSSVILVSCEAMQVEIGSCFQFFQLHYADFGHLTPHSWLRQMWNTISKYGITLCKPNTTILLPRIDDFALMDRLLESKIFNRAEVASINRCRLWLNVFFPSLTLFLEMVKIYYQRYLRAKLSIIE